MNRKSINRKAKELNKEFINRTWIGLLILALIGTPTSLLRIIDSKFEPLYAVHLFTALFIVLIYSQRKRLSLNIQSLLIVFIFLLIGVPPLFTFGFYSAAVIWLIFATLFFSIMYPKQVMWGYVGLVSLTSIAATLFVSNIITLPVDANNFITTPRSWVAVLLSTLIFTFILINGLKTLNEKLITLTDELSEQKKMIENLANFDALTGLPNLRLAIDRLDMALEQAKRKNKKVALMFLDSG